MSTVHRHSKDIVENNDLHTQCLQYVNHYSQQYLLTFDNIGNALYKIIYKSRLKSLRVTYDFALNQCTEGNCVYCSLSAARGYISGPYNHLHCPLFIICGDACPFHA